VAVDEPVEGHQARAFVSNVWERTMQAAVGWACDLLWRRLGAMGNASPALG
jgi:hypothetical protein